MADKNKLREILAILSPDGTETDFKAFDEGVDKLKSGLKQKIQAKTLQDVNGQLSRFKEGLDFEPLFKAIKDIDQNFDSRIKEVAGILADEVAKFDELSKSEREENAGKLAESSGMVESLRFELETLKGQKEKEMGDVIEALKGIPTLRAENETSFADIKARLDALEVPEEEAPDLISPINQRIDDVHRDIITKMSNMGRGDHANRNIAIGGNTSVLSTYTDINLKAGSNVSITYVKNNVTKYTDVTISASGGGGSVGGVIRSINTISTSQTAGSTPGTDYIYLCSAGINVTLPAASGNTNLYTVKNISNSSVLVSGTIDDDATGVTMPIKYTSIDLISNNTDWDIT